MLDGKVSAQLAPLVGVDLAKIALCVDRQACLVPAPMRTGRCQHIGISDQHSPSLGGATEYSSDLQQTALNEDCVTYRH